MKVSTAITALVIVTAAIVGPATSTAAPARFPASTALNNELTQSKNDLSSLLARNRRALAGTQEVRGKIQLAIATINCVGQIDDLIGRVIRQLTPISKLPPTRTVGTVVAGLTRLKQPIHQVRVKGDMVKKKFLSPTNEKLKILEGKLQSSVTTVSQTVKDTDQTQQHLAQLRSFVESRGNKTSEVAALESLAEGTSETIRPVRAGIKEVDTASAAVERDLNNAAKDLKAITDLGPAFQKLQQSLTPVNNTARDLDKALNQRIAVNVLGKNFGFTVRQVIEGPGKVADIVLQPLEKLAQDALKPILGKMKFEIQPPKEITALADALDSIDDSMTKSVSQLQTALDTNRIATFKSALAGLNAKSTTQLVSGK